MKKSDYLNALYNHPNHDVRFMANICESCSNPSKKIKTLYLLVFVDNLPVKFASFERFEFWDYYGKSHYIAELNDYETLKESILKNA